MSTPRPGGSQLCIVRYAPGRNSGGYGPPDPGLPNTTSIRIATPIPAVPSHPPSAAVTTPAANAISVPPAHSPRKCPLQICSHEPVTTAPASPASTLNPASPPNLSPARSNVRGTVPTSTASAAPARYPPTTSPTTR